MNFKHKAIYFYIVFIFPVLLACPGVCGESLYVFTPSRIRPVVLQEQLRDACPGIDIKVFGRHKDFEKQVRAKNPDAVLTKAPVVRHIGGYSVLLRGSRKGSVKEQYVLLSVDKKIDLNEKKPAIGVFDILGRKEMKKFVGNYFNPVPRMKRVSKMEDLLQLLTFNMAGAVLVPENVVPWFRELSNLNFAVTPVEKMRIDIISLAGKKGAKVERTIEAMKKIDSKTMSLLEVEKWE